MSVQTTVNALDKDISKEDLRNRVSKDLRESIVNAVQEEMSKLEDEIINGTSVGENIPFRSEGDDSGVKSEQEDMTPNFDCCTTGGTTINRIVIVHPTKIKVRTIRCL